MQSGLVHSPRLSRREVSPSGLMSLMYNRVRRSETHSKLVCDPVMSLWHCTIRTLSRDRICFSNSGRPLEWVNESFRLFQRASIRLLCHWTSGCDDTFCAKHLTKLQKNCPTRYRQRNLCGGP